MSETIYVKSHSDDSMKDCTTAGVVQLSAIQPWEQWILDADEERLQHLTFAKLRLERAKPGYTRRKEMAARYLSENGRHDQMRDQWEIAGPDGEAVTVTMEELADRRFM